MKKHSQEHLNKKTDMKAKMLTTAEISYKMKEDNTL